MRIKFQKFYVTDGSTKVSVSYSSGEFYGEKRADGTRPLLKGVSLYAKDYGRDLQKLFPTAQNDSDSSTDYFEKSRVRILPGDSLYAAAKARCDEWDAKREAQAAINDAKYAERRAAWAAGGLVAA